MAKGNRGGKRNGSTSATITHDPFNITRDVIKVSQASEDGYTNTYNRINGQVTRVEAGQLYKAVKNGDVVALPETTKMLYDNVNLNIRFASQRYNQDGLYYDRISHMTRALLNSDFKTAQALVNIIENDRIKRATRKSPYYKYISQLGGE